MVKKKKRILIVEDEVMLKEMYEEKLKQEGYRVTAAENAEEAFKAIKKERPDFILLDILLPRKNGLDILEELIKEKKGRDIKIVAFSNFDDPIAKKKAKSLGALDYLIKTDYTPAQIVNRVKKYIS